MRALIADDEPHLAAHLASRLRALWPELQLLPTAANGDEALARLNAERPDIAFLDIRMPGLSGLEVAARLAHPCKLVFVTAYDQYAIEAFERAAVDYLLKPVSDERLRQTLARLQQPTPPLDTDTLSRLAQLLMKPAPPPQLEWVRAQSGDTVRLVAVDEILYFQAADKYTLVVTADAELVIRTPIKELGEQLDPTRFWQVDRGTLVNIRQVEAAQQDELGRVTLRLRARPERIKVSRSHAHLFKQM